MKFVVFILVIGICFSCNKKDETSEQELFKSNDFPQRWDLLAITSTSSSVNVVITGDDLEWKEFYIFHSDGNFLKSREIDGDVIEAEGTFTIVDVPGKFHLELHFETGSEIRASCSQQEFLSFRENTLVNGSWVACDGPIMEYRLVTE